MEPGLSVSLSGQLTLQRRLDTIANNVANAGTVGFRAENLTFMSVLSQNAVAFSSAAPPSFSRASGALVETGNPLDVAVQGNAWLSTSTQGGVVYTRDGRLRLSPSGELQTVDGHAVLDAGGGPLRIDASLGPVQIGHNGAITQNGNSVGSIGLFRLPADAKLHRGSGTGLVSGTPAAPVTEFSDTRLLQGYVEQANVNSVMEMTRLISVSRAFEAVSTSIEQVDRKLGDAIRTLGEGRR